MDISPSWLEGLVPFDKTISASDFMKSPEFEYVDDHFALVVCFFEMKKGPNFNLWKHLKRTRFIKRWHRRQTWLSSLEHLEVSVRISALLQYMTPKLPTIPLTYRKFQCLIWMLMKNTLLLRSSQRSTDYSIYCMCATWSPTTDLLLEDAMIEIRMMTLWLVGTLNH